VGAGVVLAVVRLYLCEAQFYRTVRSGAYENAAQEIGGYLQYRPVEELPGERRTVSGRDHAVRA